MLTLTAWLVYYVYDWIKERILEKQEELERLLINKAHEVDNLKRRFNNDFRQANDRI